MGLKVKISIGYILLIFLLTTVILLFRGKEERRRTLEKEESELVDVRRLTAKVYMSLLDLSSRAEVVSIWTDDDFHNYCTRQDTVRKNLKALRHYVHTPEQQERIDSFAILMNEKKQLLSILMNTFDEDVSEIISEKIPVIVSQVRKVQREASVEKDAKILPTEKKRSIWNLFRKKKPKSAYRQQRDQQERLRQTTSVPKTVMKKESPSVTIPLLRSLDREVAEKQKAQREKLLLQMDSLYTNSQTLNLKLNTLVGNFEKEASLHLSSGYEALIAEREKSFNIASVLAAFIFLFAIILYIIVHRDVNKRYKYEKALESSDQRNKGLLHSRKNMMMTIAHDLRAPLATIKGCAELLPSEKKKSRQIEYAENILYTSDYMLGLVNTLVEFYMLDIGKVKLNTSIFCLETLFKDIIASFVSLTKKKNIPLTSALSGLDIVVNGDHLRIRQIINNLLSNAVKFTRQGEIRLDAEYSNGELRFSVRDTGSGISVEEKERIFEAFERLDNARGISGFGLGLTICARLVSQMEGALTVESRPGAGSTFMVVLPFPPADKCSGIGKERIPEYPHLEGMYVLVIDDDRIQLNVTKEMLERGGIKCDCCQTSWELIARLKSQTYDLLLTDIQMPETDGYGILELLRSSNMETAKKIPILAVTASVDKGDEYTSHGFSGRICKPFSFNELMDAVEQTTGRRESVRHEPDFSFILTDEDNKQEMLGIFITETRKDLAALATALKKQDKEASAAILHKNLPLWDSVRLDFPISRLQELVTCDTKGWTDEQLTDIGKIIGIVNQLVRYAEKIREEGA